MSALKDLDHEVVIDDLSEVCKGLIERPPAHSCRAACSAACKAEFQPLQSAELTAGVFVIVLCNHENERAAA